MADPPAPEREELPQAAEENRRLFESLLDSCGKTGRCCHVPVPASVQYHQLYTTTRCITVHYHQLYTTNSCSTVQHHQL